MLEPGRVLVGEGVLSKMCRKGPKLRYFFLFNDLLCYGTSVIDKKKVFIYLIEKSQVFLNIWFYYQVHKPASNSFKRGKNWRYSW